MKGRELMLSGSFFGREKTCRGKAVIDRRTKRLLSRILPGEIAVINHRDLDEVAAEGLVRKRVKAVINASPTLSGEYPAAGATRLVEAGIPILDRVGEKVLKELREGEPIELKGESLLRMKDGCWEEMAKGELLDAIRLEEQLSRARDRLEERLKPFIRNTLRYAGQEESFVTTRLDVPTLRVPLRGKDVVVVVRGAGYREDLTAIRSYIREVDPVLIGVDGGADALLERGWTPDLIVGDMDSVSDQALLSGAEIIVHAYPDGHSPGQKRVESLGLAPHVLPAAGTSEDLAMLMAFEEGAELIVAVGSHSHMIDFLEKGRKGMASTILVRMKVGTRLVDAKGVSRLYQKDVRAREIAWLGAAALFPLVSFALVNPKFLHLFRLFWLYLRILFP
ncbi:putative cytokinetic ring protein SteA [Salinithrix halophila]|uniref:Cytokinetic ring protein SteA n=2 Tax=Salinithrix halophila TaxID=1485204 RepID=A0ABV8JLI5_9BACL